MSLVRSSAEAVSSRKRHVLDNGTVYWKTTLIAGEPVGERRPNCFLVEQEPNSEILPHFHQANQFQVFVAGSGVLGKHTVTPVMVHYTNAHTPYGPIRSGKAGLHYFTLRDDFDPGARFMPGSRTELKHVRRRYATSAPCAAPDPRALTEVTRSAVMGPEPDGLGAFMISAPPHAPLELPELAASSGQFLMVIAGSLDHGGAVLPRLSCVFAAPGESLPLAAGPDGLSLLVLRFASEQRAN